MPWLWLLAVIFGPWAVASLGTALGGTAPTVGLVGVVGIALVTASAVSRSRARRRR